MHNGLGKLVTGIRRCWKTYLLFNLFDDYLCSKIANGREQYYVFPDEAQYAISREELKNTGVPPGSTACSTGFCACATSTRT